MTDQPIWLVTGGAGFIGSNFVRHVLAVRPTVRVVVLDKLTYAGSLENLRALPDPTRFEFVRGDIADPADVRGVFEAHRPTHVLNFAAESHVDRSIDGPRAFIDTNIVGTFELLDAARAHVARSSDAARRAFRFLHVSTDEVYGSLGAEGYFTEKTPYSPNSPYSASKAGADLLVQAYNRTYGLPTITTNCSNNYGPRQYPEKLIPLMILNALEAKPLPIYGDGGNSERSNLQVVDAICTALEALRPARDNPAMRARGLDRYDRLKTFVQDRPGHDRRYAIDASRVRAELGWTPRFDFDSALKKTVAWYLENEPWRTALLAEGDARARQGLGQESEAARTGGGGKTAR